jgi:hypothetical protein
MKPTEKSPAIDQALTDIFGVDRKGSIEAGQCVFCQAPLTNFRNAISKCEAAISGQCQKCQDEVFGYDEPDTPLLPPQPTRQFYTPTDNDFVIQRQQMISGRGSAESRRYHKYLGRSGKTWLVADQPNAAANIYVEGGPNSDGFGGSTLTFSLVDGGEVKLKGPWHANSDSLFADTDIDVRDRHYTYVVIGRRRESGEHYESIIADVLYRDDEPQLGSFHRGDELARQWAREIGAQVFLYSESEGGSSHGPVQPDAVFYWERDEKATTDLSAAQDSIVRR